MRQRLLSALLATTLLTQAGCGTLIYPERRGQTSGRIDPAIAILNGVGLLLYVVPGLVAFAIDFATGAIYLPGGRRAQLTDSPQPVDERLRSDPEALAKAVSAATGTPVSLDDPRLQVQPIPQGVSPELAVWSASLGHQPQ